MFQFPHLPPTKGGSRPITAEGLPHSETTGSMPDCGSPVVSLLVCVLRRLVVPRHPPTALHVLPGHGSLGGRGTRPATLGWMVRRDHPYRLLHACGSPGYRVAPVSADRASRRDSDQPLVSQQMNLVKCGAQGLSGALIP